MGIVIIWSATRKQFT